MRRLLDECPCAKPDLCLRLAELEAGFIDGSAVSAIRVNAWVDLAQILKATDSAVRVAEAGTGNPDLARRLRDPIRRRTIRDLLLAAGRPDLRHVTEPTMAEALSEHVGDTALGVAGLFVAPILGPMIAPR